MSDPKSKTPATGARYLNADGQTVYVDSDEHLFAFDAQLNGFKLDELDRFLERDLDPSIGYDSAVWQKLTRLRSEALAAYTAKDFEGYTVSLQILARMMSELGGRRAALQAERDRTLIEGAVQGAAAVALVRHGASTTEANRIQEDLVPAAIKPEAPIAEEPLPGWKARIQIEATNRCQLTKGKWSQFKLPLSVSLADWCIANDVRTDRGLFPSAEYIRKHVLGARYWTPPN